MPFRIYAGLPHYLMYICNMSRTRIITGLLLACMTWLPVTQLQAQVFHFQNTTTTLELTTQQTPAHWYIEIFNDVGVDTTLRWKSNFVNIPAAWSVQLDVQTGIFLNIQSGDSADFLLKDSMLFPQKLIIGAWLNNTPTVGSVFFDIYDPYTPGSTITIEYHFIITPPLGTGENRPSEPVIIAPGQVRFSERSPYAVFTTDGRLVRDGIADPGWLKLPELHPGMYVLQWKSGAGLHHRKWMAMPR